MAHPLFDRRDLTAQRDRAGAPPAGADPWHLLLAGLGETNGLLRELLAQESADISELCVSDREPPEQLMANFPTRGVQRMIVRRPGSGGSYPCAAGTPVPVLQPNENRLGGNIVNSGANAVTLYLAADLLEPGTSTPIQGAPQLRLNGGGSSWNLKLSDVLWCGSVIAIADTGGSTLSVAEV